MKATDIAKKASELVAGERDRTHGDKLNNFENIAAYWNAFLHTKRPGTVLDAKDVAVMMTLLKLARMYSGEHNTDDSVDACGYAACAGEIASLMDEKALAWQGGKAA